MSVKHFGNTFTVTVISCMAENRRICSIINTTFRDAYQGKLEAIFKEVGTPKRAHVMNHFINPDREEILLPRQVFMKGNGVVILTTMSTASTGRKVLDTVINARGDHNIPIVLKVLDDEDTFALKDHEVVAPPLEMPATDGESERRMTLAASGPSPSRCFEGQYRGRLSTASSQPRKEKSVANFIHIPSSLQNSCPAPSMPSTTIVHCQKNSETVRQAFDNVKHAEKRNEFNLINNYGKYVTECNSLKENCFESGQDQQNLDTDKSQNLSPSDVIKTDSQKKTNTPDVHTSRHESIVLPVENVTNVQDDVTQRISHMNERLLKLCEETSRVFLEMPKKRVPATYTEAPRDRFPAFLRKHAKSCAFFTRVNRCFRPVQPASAGRNLGDQELPSGARNHDTKKMTLQNYKFPEILKKQHLKKQSHCGIGKIENIKSNASATSDNSCSKLKDTLEAVLDKLCEIVKQQHASPIPGRRYTYDQRL